jgi:hypothetical protein
MKTQMQRTRDGMRGRSRRGTGVVFAAVFAAALAVAVDAKAFPAATVPDIGLIDWLLHLRRLETVFERHGDCHDLWEYPCLQQGATHSCSLDGVPAECICAQGPYDLEWQCHPVAVY